MDAAQEKQATPMKTYADRRPGILTGALVGLLTSAALAALFFLASAVLGLVMAPFAITDWLARNLPGNIITNFAIDPMVTLIETLNLGETSSTAKTIEQFMGVAALVVVGMIAGAVFFALMNRRPAGNTQLPGVIMGAVLGLPLGLVGYESSFASDLPGIANFAWIFLACAAWGVAVNWIYNDLASIRRSDAQVEGLDRRSFLIRVGGATATITVVGAGLGALLGGTGSEVTPTTVDDEGEATTARANLPNADAAVQPAPGTRPEYTPVEDHYRIDISTVPPVIDGATYALPIYGLVDNDLSLTLDDIAGNYTSMDQYITLACISNRIGGDLIGTTKWTGVPLRDILADAGLQPDARYLRIYSADSFDETLDISMIRADERIMLAYQWDDQPLTREHGFPLRVYIPDRYGMKQPKWITEIEVVAEYAEGYWVRRGWSEAAIMNATSVVDTVAVDAIYEENGSMFVPVGGIAHAGDRSISKVEVRVDGGEWVEAQLRAPLSDKTWVLWRYDWPFADGRHTFEVRCVDGNGRMQIEERASPRPDGATGIHSRTAEVALPENTSA